MRRSLTLLLTLLTLLLALSLTACGGAAAPSGGEDPGDAAVTDQMDPTPEDSAQPEPYVISSPQRTGAPWTA